MVTWAYSRRGNHTVYITGVTPYNRVYVINMKETRDDRKNQYTKVLWIRTFLGHLVKYQNSLSYHTFSVVCHCCCRRGSHCHCYCHRRCLCTALLATSLNTESLYLVQIYINAPSICTSNIKSVRTT